MRLIQRAGMVEWNGIFRVFRFSGILGQPREVHPKFRNEIPENDCSIRFPTRNFRKVWSNGKRPWSSITVKEFRSFIPLRKKHEHPRGNRSLDRLPEVSFLPCRFCYGARVNQTNEPIGHFLVTFCLCFKTCVTFHTKTS